MKVSLLDFLLFQTFLHDTGLNCDLPDNLSEKEVFKINENR